MKAVVKYARGEGTVELREIEEPTAKPGDVKVEVKAAGVCGTDIHIYSDEYPSDPPVALGHEFSGVVVECGEGVTGFAPGDRVTSRTYYITCGKCEYCRTGRDNLCYDRKSIGSGVHGAMAKYVIVPEGAVFRLPDNVSFLGGALSEPLSCAVHGVLLANQPQPDERVLVTGPGAIGILAAQVAKACGAHVTLLGTPSDAARLDLARQLGVDETITTSDLDTILEREKRGGFDCVYECSGFGPGIDSAIKLAKRGGRYTQLGLTGKPVPVEIDQIVFKQLKVAATFAHVWACWPKAMALLASGKVQTEPLATHRFAIDDWKKAFDTFRSREGIKMIIEP